MTTMPIEQKVAQLLTSQRKTVATAESCTGGLLGHRLTQISGSSRFYHGGFIVYSNAAKIRLLGISPKILKKVGAVSEKVATEMAQRARKILNSDFGIGITGIAGPTGGSKKKPVGLTYIAVATKNEFLCIKCLLKGKRPNIKQQTTTQALSLLLEFL